MLLSANHAPKQLRTSGELWIDIEFPELLANGIGSARAVLRQGEAGVEMGDVVEIKFAHDDNPRYFPVNEVTRVAGLVAKKDAMLAESCQRRILARQQQVPARLDWLAQALSLPSGAGNASPTIAASVTR